MDFRIKFGRIYDYKKHEMKKSAKEKIQSLWFTIYERLIYKLCGITYDK